MTTKFSHWSVSLIQDMYLINMQQQQSSNKNSRAAAAAATAFFVKMQTGSQVVSDRLTCTNTATKQINQSLRWATEIHIMWLLSYSTWITPIPVTSQRRGEAAVFTEGQEKEEKENYSLRLLSMAVCRCAWSIIVYVTAFMITFLQKQKYFHSTLRHSAATTVLASSAGIYKANHLYDKWY